MLYEDNYCLVHYGIKGQLWGVRRFQNLDGTLTEEGKRRYSKNDVVFISGSSKTQDKESEYYRKELPKEIRNEIDEAIKSGSKFVVGDAPGIDRQVQDYLVKKDYNNVEVYGPGEKVRYSANSKWKTNPINDTEHEPGSKEWLAKKDKAMTDAATVGIAVVLDEGAKATRANVQRLMEQNKDVSVFSLNRDKTDEWVSEKVKAEAVSNSMRDIKYKNFKKLMSPDEVRKQKSGSCHDQVMLELDELRKAGLDPHALFVMEHKGNKGGMTHSLVYFIKNNKVYWIENAWAEKAGIREFDSLNAIKKEIKQEHANGNFGNKKNYSDLSFGDFNDKDQKIGETLQELIDNVKWH